MQVPIPHRAVEVADLSSISKPPQKTEGIVHLVGEFKHFLFSPLFGEDSQFDLYFSDGLKPPTSHMF